MRDQDIIDAIESLIRQHIRYLLSPAEPKTPVLGGVGVAYAPSWTDYAPMYMETGFTLVGNWGLAPFPVPRDLIYGDEVAINAGQATQPYTLIGELDMAFWYGDATPTWIDLVNRIYPSLVLTEEFFSDQVDGDITPSRYTGELRLLAQALLGAGRHTSGFNFTRSNNPQEADRLGLLCNEDVLTYGMAEINNEGICRWGKLEFSTVGTELRTWLLNNPGLSDYNKTRYRAYLFSTAKNPQVQGAIVIAGLADHLSNDDLPGTPGDYELLLDWAPISYGFHFNADGTEAVCVFHRFVKPSGEFGWIDTRRIRIDFEFDTDITEVTATAVIVDEGEYAPSGSIDPVWLPSAPGKLVRLRGGYPIRQFDTETPIYDFYGVDYDTGQEDTKLLTYTNLGDIDNETIPRPTLHCCGAGGDQTDYGQFTTGKLSYFTAVGDAYQIKNWDGMTWEREEFQGGGGGSYSEPLPSFPFSCHGVLGPYEYCNPGWDCEAGWGQCPGNARYYALSYAFFTHIHTVIAGYKSATQGVIIPHGDSQGYYVVRRETVSGTIDVSTWSGLDNGVGTGVSAYIQCTVGTKPVIGPAANVNVSMYYDQTMGSSVVTNETDRNAQAVYEPQASHFNKKITVRYVGATSDHEEEYATDTPGVDPSGGWEQFIRQPLADEIFQECLTASGAVADAYRRQNPTTPVLDSGYASEPAGENATIPWFIGGN